jgi:hypothetical protein
MAKHIVEIETKILLENIKKGEFHVSKSKVLQEDVNAQILLAMEIREAAKKTLLKKGY